MPYPPLDDAIVDAPYQYEFVQLLRILEWLSPELAQVGTSAAITQEFVRLKARTSLAFPAAEVHELTPPADSEVAPRVEVNFFGLTGILGALPASYSELLLQRMAQRDHTLRDFLDLFNHRLLSLFYRAWDKYRFWIHEERRARNRSLRQTTDRSRNPVVDVLLASVGMLGPGVFETAAAGQRLATPENTFTFFSGILSQERRPVVTLEQILSRVYGWPVVVQQFVGRWLPLELSEQSQLARSSLSVLGESVVVGSRVWDVQSQFCTQNGPLDYQQFSTLLPVGLEYRSYVELVRFYAGPEFDFSIVSLLRSECVPPCCLGEDADPAPRLGWNTWLCSRPPAGPTVSVQLRVRDG